MNADTIVATYTGHGPSYRQVWHVMRGNKFIAQYSILSAARAAYPKAKIEP